MAAGSSAPSHHRIRTRGFLWFQRNEFRLLVADIVCIALLFLMYLFTSIFHIFTQEVAILVQIAAIVPAVFIALSVVWKGAVPSIICVLGIVLMHNAVILPYYSEPESKEVYFWGRTFVLELYTPASVSMGSNMNFVLGLGMVGFSIIIAYQPSILFTRNRPESLESEWSKYHKWHDNTLLAGGHMERSVPVKSLMTDQDRYLLWRYEYVLTVIYGAAYLVRPNGLVPKGSIVMRDRESGRVLGKPRYTGFFV